jgi:predicted membrane protein
MTQSKLASLFETLTSIVIGFIVSVILTALVLPYYGHHVTLSQNLQITAIFTVTSIIRGYFVRRWFDGMRHD